MGHDELRGAVLGMRPALFMTFLTPGHAPSPLIITLSHIQKQIGQRKSGFLAFEQSGRNDQARNDDASATIKRHALCTRGQSRHGVHDELVSSVHCGEPGGCGSAVRWRCIAPARKELHNGSNKSEREPTNGRSTNYGRGHLVPAFRSIGRNFS